MPIKADIELNIGVKTFASGLLVELIAALRRSRSGDLMAVIGSDGKVGTEIEAWCKFTRNSLVDVSLEGGRYRWVIRCGEAPAEADGEAPGETHRSLGSRLWLYTNFNCNLRCDYCCVRSSPKAPRRALGLERVRRIASEAAALGVGEIFVTGGEPFLLADIGDILTACATTAPNRTA
jgi:TusA-related sulfurtransferase